ncbi:unnamed protein product [Ilex paraguariensis]|uniref:Receptor-like serine/threonine-protein kinase n=1 Tax=Ilex paraguariensis TaxID=185542 RepID=A0ABC8R5Q9_9AQUA
MVTHIFQRFFIIWLLFLLSLIASNEAYENVSLGSSIKASDRSSSWQSSSGDFAFGFRRIENQNLFLLAIWFDNIPNKTLVWYANGDNPAPEGSKIDLTLDGQFILSDPQGVVVWKPQPFPGRVDYAAMMDTGNFVLAGNSSEPSGYLWESFKHPTDTILPTQVLETGGMLSSRQKESNYSKGRFQLRLLPDGNLVLNTIALPTEYAYEAYYVSDTFGGSVPMNSGYLVVFNQTGYIYIVRRNGDIKNLTSGDIVPTKEFYHRAILEYDGVFTQYAHRKAPRSGSLDETWSRVWSIPNDICSDIQGERGGGTCGFNSYCILGANGRPVCECLPGFSFVDPNNKFNGCNQDKVQQCEQNASNNPRDLYEMRVLSNTFWPNSANFEMLPFNEDKCTSSCLDDCNCVVAVIAEGICHKKKLPLSNGRVNRNRSGKALIKLLKSEVSPGNTCFPEAGKGKKDQATLILVGSLLLGGSVFLNFLLIPLIAIVAFSSYHKIQKLNRVSSLSTIIETNLRPFTFEDLRLATEGFKEELGRGAFGTVYKGVLASTSTSSTIVAVKQLNKLVQESEKEFKTEITAIAKTHHKNLVRLLGFCEEGPHRLLVYEFMSNGTLASFLFGNSTPDWDKRTQMALGIAKGIMYLHEECSTQIIHCDIKPQNILLDDSFTARISDFGLAKLLMNDQTRTNTAIRGTKGYVAPEWFRSTPINAKVDVYSYGVLLLEIICCRKNVEMEKENEEEAILIDWAYDCYKLQRLDKLVENDEEARNDMRRLERLVMVAIWCIQEDPSLRPSMKKVIQMIEGVVEVSAPPCPSPFSSN